MMKTKRHATMNRLFPSLVCDHHGGAALEFGLIAPVLLTMIMGSIEVGYEVYMRNVLDGTMSKAARDLTLENAADAAVRAQLDNRIRETLGLIDEDATVVFERESFSRYRQVNNKTEPHNDANGNGKCDKRETFEDINGNGVFDKYGGTADWGNANDAVIYTATVTFQRLLPLSGLIGLPDEASITTTKMLRIQPYALKKKIKVQRCVPAKLSFGQAERGQNAFS